MSGRTDVAETLDAKGQSCPVPVVKTREAVDRLDPGAVLEVHTTDRGSVSDIEGWAAGTNGVELLDQHDEDGVYHHYVRRTEDR
jgi:TusA-related sulfurtransferase